MNCSKCNSPLEFDAKVSGYVDYRTGNAVIEGDSHASRALCSDCFMAAIDALCNQINNASPETLDAVYITGMADLNAREVALQDMAEIDAIEDGRPTAFDFGLDDIDQTAFDDDDHLEQWTMDTLSKLRGGTLNFDEDEE